MSLMNYLTVDGSAYDIGRRQGEKLGALIRYVYQQRLCGHDGREVVKDRDRLIEQVAARWPEQLDEVRGYADGAGIAFEHAFDFNFGRFLSPSRQNCSNLAFRESPDGPILGGTLDDAHVYCVQLTRRQGAYAHVAVVWPGWLSAYGGVNEHGLAVSGSSTRFHKSQPPEPKEAPLFSSIYTARLTLETCRNVQEAIELLKRDGIPGHGNHILMDADGDGAVVESHKPTGPATGSRSWEPGGYLWCGNFFLSEFTVEEAARYPGLVERADRARTILAFARRGVDKGGSIRLLQDFLTSHDAPEPTLSAICNPHTCCAMIAVPRERKILVSERYPCANEFVEYRLA